MRIFKKLFITAVILAGLLTFIQAQTNAQNLYSAVLVSGSGTTGNLIANANTSRCLAVTADGTIYAVYHGSNGIRVAKSTNRGASFSPSVLVKNSDFETEIAVSSTGTVYITWVESGNAYLSKSTDNGTTFSSPIKVGTVTASVHMAVDGNYVYLIDRPGTTFYYSSDSGQTFKKQTFSETNVFSDVHVNRLTGEVIVQKDSPVIVYYVSQDHGQTFGSKKAPKDASVNYSVGSISAGPLGSYLFIGGYSTMGTRVNLSDGTAKALSLGSSLTPQGRSLSVDGFGNVVTGFVNNGNVYYAASKDLGDTFSSTCKVAAASMANAAINTTNGDVMFLYEAGGKIYLSVFGDELTGYNLDVSTTNLNFGNQEVGTSSAKKDITVTNKSSKAIAVTKLDITGSDFSVSHNIGSALDPGQSYTISVVFTPSKFNTCSGMISIYTDASKDPRTIQLSGSGADTTIPNTTAQISGTKGSDGKYTGDVTLKFDASDIAGIAKTEYSINNGQSWIQASGSAVFSDEGDYNVLYRSVDTANNVETAKQISFTIKKLPKTVTLTYSSGDHGHITGQASQTVNYGESGTEVTAMPDEGYHFVKWSDGKTDASRIDENITSDASITATFAINTYTLNYSGIHGSISGLASQTVDFGGSGTEVTAVPDEGYHFVKWSDGKTDASRIDGNITTDASITATFAINTYNDLKYNSIFDSSNPQDIVVNTTGAALKAIMSGTAALTADVDYSVVGNTITLKKSYLTYFFTKFNAPGQKLNLIFDFEDSNDPVLTITRAPISNFITCDKPIFDSSNLQDITINTTGAALKAIMSGTAALIADVDYSVAGNTITLKKSYLAYFFTKFNAPWQKLNLVFDFEDGNDPLFTVTRMPITNFVFGPVFDPSNTQDISINISGNTLAAIKSGTASLNSWDYSVSGNTVTIKRSYLTYFFTKFTDPRQKLNLIFDFEKGNDPLFTIYRKAN